MMETASSLSFTFGKDVFLKTDFPTAVDSQDTWSPPDQESAFFGMPISFMSDFHDGGDFARALLSRFPGKTKILDLGTATGSIPLTMRRAGLMALGIDGLDIGKRGLIKPSMFLRGTSGGNDADLFAWNVAPEIVDCCDITKPFRIEDASGDQVKFDYIISTDCFEHLVTERVPQLVDNIYDHMADDGFGIFEISTGMFMHLHQTVQPAKWWEEHFERRFVIDREKSEMDFVYARSYVANKELRYRSTGDIDGYKILFWVSKKI